ncbi:hypothetical protein Csa_005311 [Cucumis sativus]|uniref:Uncharacterized protein n=1 Tax=Cucumis sativus TaxID=3659 RepID=A0A0A0KDP4_CUCSA|nr:hypothetical protein Csa_005311 [Cucumis sativus]
MADTPKNWRRMHNVSTKRLPMQVKTSITTSRKTVSETLTDVVMAHVSETLSPRQKNSTHRGCRLLAKLDVTTIRPNTKVKHCVDTRFL